MKLVPEILILEVKDAFIIKGKVSNFGDETAQDVRLELIESGLIIKNFGSLPAGKGKQVFTNATREQLGVKEEGSYYIPVLIFYRDLTGRAYSASHLIATSTNTKKSGISEIRSPVSLSIKRENSQRAEFDMVQTTSVVVNFQNTSNESQEIEIVPITSNEIAIKPSASTNRLSLTPKSQQEFTLNIENLSGLSGSKYQIFVMIRGTYLGKHYSEYTSLLVHLVTEEEQNYLPLILVAIALLFAAYGFMRYRKKAA
ncbi:MAG: hypothetical protein HQM14_14750 [SAR324 cluster bacterium]|nr:hypothetical protein [SAR324 cluster bacterium]